MSQPSNVGYSTCCDFCLIERRDVVVYADDDIDVACCPDCTQALKETYDAEERPRWWHYWPWEMTNAPR